MRQRFPITGILVLLAVLMAVAACGGDDDDDAASSTPTSGIPSISGPQPQPQPAQPLASEETAPSDGVIEVGVEGSRFQQNLLRVPQGEAVTIRVTNNDGTTHNLRLAGIDGAYDTEDDAVTTPESIPADGVGELSFAPPVAGAYTFRCDFHPGSMGGQVIVGDATPGSAVTPSPSESPSGSPEDTGEATEGTPAEGEETATTDGAAAPLN